MKIDMRDAFFNKLVSHAINDPSIMILTADHGAFALRDFSKLYPKQYINIGISEQNMIGVAAGLALSGKTVFVYGISPFVSLRVLEHLTIDVAAMNLPVNVVSVGAGFTYSTDGQTHLGLQDVGAVMTIPGMTILNSSDPQNTSDFVDLAISSQKPHYIRIEKENLANFTRLNIDYLKDGFSLLMKGESDLLVISTGSVSQEVLEVLDKIKSENNFSPSHIDLHQFKPLKENAFIKLIMEFKRILVVDEHYATGLEAIIAKVLFKVSWGGKLYSHSVDEDFIFTGHSRNSMREKKQLSKNELTMHLNNLIF